MLMVANFTVLAESSIPVPMTTFTITAIIKSFIQLALIVAILRLGVQMIKDKNSGIKF